MSCPPKVDCALTPMRLLPEQHYHRLKRRCIRTYNISLTSIFTPTGFVLVGQKNDDEFDDDDDDE